jgi:hypothetical protein
VLAREYGFAGWQDLRTAVLRQEGNRGLRLHYRRVCYDPSQRVPVRPSGSCFERARSWPEPPESLGAFAPITCPKAARLAHAARSQQGLAGQPA